MMDDMGIFWKDGVPKDATTFVMVQVFVSTTIYMAVGMAAALGVVIAITFLSFNIFYRKQRLIRMSSPVLNNVILMGCMVVYLTVFLQATSPANVALLCQLRTITIMMGFSLSFGALFAKTWRVYVIFTNTSNKKVAGAGGLSHMYDDADAITLYMLAGPDSVRLIDEFESVQTMCVVTLETLRDVHLLLMVGVLVLLDVIGFGLSEILDTRTVENTLTEIEVLDNGDLIVEKEILTCTSPYSLYFQAAVFVYKGLLLIFGAFLAWQTRKVNLPALNDSQYIGMCVYNVTVLSILGVVLLFALGQQVELQYALVSAFIIFATSIVQLTIFIPKVLKLHSLRNGVSDAEETTETGTSFSRGLTTMASGTMDSSKEMRDLWLMIDAVNKELAETEVDVNKIKSILKADKF